MLNVKVKLKQNDELKCWTSASEQTNTVEEFHSGEINGQSLEVVELHQSSCK